MRKNKLVPYFLYYIIICIATIVIDWVTKYLVVKYIPENSIVKCIDGLFHLTYINNEGAAFGMLANHRWVFMVFSTVAILILIGYIIYSKPQNIWLRTALSLIVGGGIGNMIDRIGRGAVIDFIDFEFVKFYVFNVADACVTVGCAIVIVYLIAVEIPNERKKKKEALVENLNTESDDKGNCDE